MFRFALSPTVISTSLLFSTVLQAGKDRHDIVVMWDAMRRYFTRPELAPTIFWLFAIKPTTPAEGRVLSDPLIAKVPSYCPAQKTRREVTATNGAVVWKQYLHTFRANDTVSLKEGNSSTTFRP